MIAQTAQPNPSPQSDRDNVEIPGGRIECP